MVNGHVCVATKICRENLNGTIKGSCRSYCKGREIGNTVGGCYLHSCCSTCNTNLQNILRSGEADDCVGCCNGDTSIAGRNNYCINTSAQSDVVSALATGNGAARPQP